MTDQIKGNFEFLNFIVDISDPGTGEIRLERLGAWLGLTPKDLIERWRRSGHERWTDYANDVLRVLDRMHDRTHALSRTFDWYRSLPLSVDTALTGDELVALGRAAEALNVLRDATCPCGQPSNSKSEMDPLPQPYPEHGTHSP